MCIKITRKIISAGMCTNTYRWLSDLLCPLHSHCILETNYKWKKPNKLMAMWVLSTDQKLFTIHHLFYYLEQLLFPAQNKF